MKKTVKRKIGKGILGDIWGHVKGLFGKNKSAIGNFATSLAQQYVPSSRKYIKGAQNIVGRAEKAGLKRKIGRPRKVGRPKK